MKNKKTNNSFIFKRRKIDFPVKIQFILHWKMKAKCFEKQACFIQKNIHNQYNFFSYLIFECFDFLSLFFIWKWSNCFVVLFKHFSFISDF